MLAVVLQRAFNTLQRQLNGEVLLLFILFLCAREEEQMIQFTKNPLARKPPLHHNTNDACQAHDEIVERGHALSVDVVHVARSARVVLCATYDVGHECERVVKA